MEEKISKIKLIGDELFNYLLKRYNEGQLSVRLGEIEDYIWNRYGGKIFVTKGVVDSYVIYVAHYLERRGVLILTKEIGEKGYRATLTLNYLNSSMYRPGKLAKSRG